MSIRVSAFFARALLVVTAGLAPSAAAGEVWILDVPPVGPFPTITQAILAASEGDLLLIDPGTYAESPQIDGKSLSLVGAPGASPVVRGTLRVKNLAAGQRVIVRGLHMDLIRSVIGPAARFENNLGVVRLEECHLDGGRTGSVWPWEGEPALSLISSAQVIVSASTLHAGGLGYCAGCEPSNGGDGLLSIQSAVALFGCELRGGGGSNETYPSGGHGGHGARVEGYGLVASGCAIQGGAGGGGDYIGCNPGGDGGDGLRIVGAQARLLDTTLAGGGGGWGSCNDDGAPGVPIDATDSSVQEHPGPSRSISVMALAQHETLVTVHVSGVPGDHVALFVADEPAFTYAPELNGLWAIEPVTIGALRAGGTVPASGMLELEIKVPALPPGEAHRLHFLQGLCRSTVGESFLTAPTHLWAYRSPLP